MKARKFQVITHEPFANPATRSALHPSSSTHISLDSIVPSASSIEITLHPPLSAKLQPPLRALVSDDFERYVEKIRMELRDSDLSHKLALLREVWALELPSVVSTSAWTSLDATESFTSDFRVGGEDSGYLSIPAMSTFTPKLTTGTSTYLSN